MVILSMPVEKKREKRATFLRCSSYNLWISQTNPCGGRDFRIVRYFYPARVSLRLLGRSRTLCVPPLPIPLVTQVAGYQILGFLHRSIHAIAKRLLVSSRNRNFD
ncbi:hypothetical protein NIES4075_42680 [Tolypothrix sp. NIES-4075]|nr:hypothetical protein NIES4075_42680 [Tolypothrix sp. NIES-4075]